MSLVRETGDVLAVGLRGETMPQEKGRCSSAQSRDLATALVELLSRRATRWTDLHPAQRPWCCDF
jgi:hypothetical protein